MPAKKTKRVSVKKSTEESINLTDSVENTTLEDKIAALEAENEKLRGRANQRPSVTAESDSFKSKRKFVARRSKLDVSHLYQTHPHIVGGKCLRWVNDEDGELQNMEFNGWQVVMLDDHAAVSDRRFADDRTVSAKTKQGTAVTIPAGRGKLHNHIKMVLMMKDKADFEADEVQAQRDTYASQMMSMARGKAQRGVEGSELDGENDRVDNVGNYAPDVGGGIHGMKLQQELIKGA